MHSTPISAQNHDTLGQLLQQERLILDDKTGLQILEGKIDIRTVLKAGLETLLQDALVDADVHGSTSSAVTQEHTATSIQLRTDRILVVQNISKEYVAPLPDIYRNNIRIKQLLFVAACVANASLLGLSLEGLDYTGTESPFFRRSISESAAKELSLNGFLDLKTHLRPSVTQLTTGHHPYIDVLPFPTFRERLIKLACSKEPIIDEDELCHDLENDGLICWGSSLGGGSSAVGSGAPWDIRSWEAQDWFVKKWWILIGGVDGEIYKQTQWWREMRGEKACYPW